LFVLLQSFDFKFCCLFQVSKKKGSETKSEKLKKKAKKEKKTEEGEVIM